MTEIKVSNPEHLAQIVEAARKASNSDSPVALLAEALEAHIDDVAENNKRVSEAQERTRERLNLTDVAEARDDVESDSGGSQTNAEAKQEELQSRILG